MTTTRTIDTSVSPFRDVRTDLAAAIEAATGWTTFPTYVTAFSTPCVILTGGGWAMTATGLTGYRVSVSCVLANQAGDLSDEVEEIARLAALACIDNQWAVPEVPAPGLFQVGDRGYAGVQFTAQALVTLRSI